MLSNKTCQELMFAIIRTYLQNELLFPICQAAHLCYQDGWEGERELRASCKQEVVSELLTQTCAQSPNIQIGTPSVVTGDSSMLS